MKTLTEDKKDVNKYEYDFYISKNFSSGMVVHLDTLTNGEEILNRHFTAFEDSVQNYNKRLTISVYFKVVIEYPTGEIDVYEEIYHNTPFLESKDKLINKLAAASHYEACSLILQTFTDEK